MALLTIGELATRTGLPVRTIRFYADRGVVPEAGRTEAGYRLFEPTAVARLRLVRTLRELGVGLDGIRRVAAREVPVREVAAAHAAALDAQIQTLRLRRTALGAIAAHADDEEIERMHDLATLTAEERRRIVEDYLDAVFSGAEGDGAVLEKMRMAPPELPDDPTPAQLEAWIEVARLLRDPDFRAASRAMAERAAAGPQRSSGSPAVSTAVAERACRAARDGVDPASAEALEVVEALEAVAADGLDREERADHVEAFSDRRVARYWQLVGIVNGWPERPDVLPAWEWFAAALRAHA